MRMTLSVRLPTRLPKLYRARGHVVYLADFVAAAQRALPLSERPLVNSHRVARALREQGYDIASHSDNRRAIANVSMTPAEPLPHEYVVCGQRLARVYG